MKNSDVIYLTSTSIEQFQPEHKKKPSHKIEKLKESNLNKNILKQKINNNF